MWKSPIRPGENEAGGPSGGGAPARGSSFSFEKEDGKKTRASALDLRGGANDGMEVETG